MLQAPFPWFGGKRRVADVVWRAFGDVPNYVEPFFGSGAVLLNRPHTPRIETINDRDALVCNFWRAIKHAYDKTADWADYPVIESDLHARHIWLVSKMDCLLARLEGDPEWCDPKIAGWWVWGVACWIGGEFCSGKGPWQSIDGKLVRLGSGGQGVTRRLVHLGDSSRGVNRKLVRLSDWFGSLSERLANVRVCCGDWSRVCGPSPTFINGVTGVFLDPPYSADAGRDPTIYRSEDLDVSHAAAAWARDVGNRSDMRIALCGYEGEHEMPGWAEYAWKAAGGYGAGKGGIGDANAHRERIWFSPHCLPMDQQFDLFEAAQ